MRDLRLILKFITSSTGKQIFLIYILPNIPRGKDNQTKKFDQLIEYKMTNIFS